MGEADNILTRAEQSLPRLTQQWILAATLRKQQWRYWKLLWPSHSSIGCWELLQAQQQQKRAPNIHFSKAMAGKMSPPPTRQAVAVKNTAARVHGVALAKECVTQELWAQVVGMKALAQGAHQGE